VKPTCISLRAAVENPGDVASTSTCHGMAARRGDVKSKSPIIKNEAEGPILFTMLVLQWILRVCKRITSADEYTTEIFLAYAECVCRK
jgi:hypothetical protein